MAPKKDEEKKKNLGALRGSTETPKVTPLETQEQVSPGAIETVGKAVQDVGGKIKVGAESFQEAASRDLMRGAEFAKKVSGDVEHRPIGERGDVRGAIRTVGGEPEFAKEGKEITPEIVDMAKEEIAEEQAPTGAGAIKPTGTPKAPAPAGVTAPTPESAPLAGATQYDTGKGFSPAATTEVTPTRYIGGKPAQGEGAIRPPTGAPGGPTPAPEYGPETIGKTTDRRTGLAISGVSKEAGEKFLTRKYAGPQRRLVGRGAIREKGPKMPTIAEINAMPTNTFTDVMRKKAAMQAFRLGSEDTARKATAETSKMQAETAATGQELGAQRLDLDREKAQMAHERGLSDQDIKRQELELSKLNNADQKAYNDSLLAIRQMDAEAKQSGYKLQDEFLNPNTKPERREAIANWFRTKSGGQVDAGDIKSHKEFTGKYDDEGKPVYKTVYTQDGKFVNRPGAQENLTPRQQAQSTIQGYMRDLDMNEKQAIEHYKKQLNK